MFPLTNKREMSSTLKKVQGDDDKDEKKKKHCRHCKALISKSNKWAMKHQCCGLCQDKFYHECYLCGAIRLNGYLCTSEGRKEELYCNDSCDVERDITSVQCSSCLTDFEVSDKEWNIETGSCYKCEGYPPRQTPSEKSPRNFDDKEKKKQDIKVKAIVIVPDPLAAKVKELHDKTMALPNGGVGAEGPLCSCMRCRGRRRENAPGHELGCGCVACRKLWGDKYKDEKPVPVGDPTPVKAVWPEWWKDEMKGSQSPGDAALVRPVYDGHEIGCLCMDCRIGRGDPGYIGDPCVQCKSTYNVCLSANNKPYCNTCFWD